MNKNQNIFTNYDASIFSKNVCDYPILRLWSQKAV